MRKNNSNLLVAIVAILGSTSALASNYAEEIYADYSKASAGAIQFDLKVLRSGPLTELAGRSTSEYLGMPSYTLTATNTGLGLSQVSLAPVDLKAAYLSDLNVDVAQFSAAGFPIETGVYRLLEVSFSDSKQSRSHVALEACFPAQGYCSVFDPSVEFIDSEVKNLRSLRASGWAIQEYSEPVDVFGVGSDASTKAGVCGLASKPSTKSRSWTSSARSVTYKNLFNITMVGKSIGGAQWGVRCDTSCKPQPFGYANSSSAWANIPFSVKCDNEVNSGTSGSSAKYIAKTGCSHRTVLGAKLNFTKSGVGIGVDINIDATGSVDQNGGTFTDRCAYF